MEGILIVIKLKNNSKFNLLLIILWDILSVCLSIILGFKLRFGMVGALPPRYASSMIYYVLIMSLVALLSNTVMQCYSTIWRYFSHKDFMRQVMSTLLASLFVILIDNFIGLEMPFEMFILIPTLMLIFMVTGRWIPRGFLSYKKSRMVQKKVGSKIKTLIYGAGEAGNHLIANLNQSDNSNIQPMGFIDDDETLWDLKMGKLPVICGGDKLEFVITDLNIKELIIAIPTASPEFIKNIYMLCQKHGVIVKRYGSLDDVTEEDFRKATIKRINFEELLRRDSINLNMAIVNKFIQNKVVLVTGGVGSIGSEICRQVLKFGASKLIIFDINENGLFFIKNELEDAGYTGKFEVMLGSIRDRARLREIFTEFEPAIVFHAAAHKHVPMMEGNPKEAIKNNVLGTINVANEAVLREVEKFILISTDKAVNPTNIMGASKRVAEIAIQTMDKISSTEFAAVRFGNVLGSNGSVVPHFINQIESGGPVTVTHPDMQRYFMTIPEAVQLVLEAGAMAQGGEIFVLDMGEPVKIYDLACDLIKLHGFEPKKDIDIVFTGLRPGEKLFEEISLDGEQTTKTSNNKIFICKPTEHNSKEFSNNIKRLETVIKGNDINEMFDIVKEMVTTFEHNKNEELQSKP